MKIRGTDFVYYQTSDIDKAIEFYRDTLGLEMNGYFEEVKWAEFNAGNATFAINDPTALDPNLKPQTGGAAVAFAVDDLEAAMKELEDKGVPVVAPLGESPVCHFACISDPDGNTVWLHRRKDESFGDCVRTAPRYRRWASVRGPSPAAWVRSTKLPPSARYTPPSIAASP
jgi:predicted enzyme related to lactoylglutathione lyase